MTRILFAILIILATPVAAQAFDRISDKATFLTLLDGKSLTNRLYDLALNVTTDGAISGAAFGKTISGAWDWQDGYFCREMAWGERVIPYNCQLVEARGAEVRFTSDQGTGDSASFKLR